MASDFYKYNTSDEEKLRIEKLELFDEYEAWHLKCTHYSLFSATKGDYCDKIVKTNLDLIKSFYEIVNESSIFAKHSGFEEPIVKIRRLGVKFGVRFGHTMCSIASKLYVFGGFGELATDSNGNGKHLRHSAIEIYDLEKMTLNVVDSQSSQIGILIYHYSQLVHIYLFN